MTRISVIIPAQNNEQTIKRCIASIYDGNLNSELEVIVVVNNSSDSTADIVSSLQEIYPNLILIEIPHAGVSHARNVGLKKASGDIITFCDADDYILDKTIDKVLNAYSKTSADIIYSGYKEIHGDSCRESVIRYPDSLVDSSTFRRMLINDIEVLGSVCNKFYKAEVLKDQFFDEDIELCEDTLFNMQLLKNTNYKIYSLGFITYAYIKHLKSATASSNNLFDADDNLKYLHTFDLISSLYKEDSDIQNQIGYKKFTLATENYYYAFDIKKQNKLKAVIKDNLKYVLRAKEAPSKSYYLSQALKVLTGKK